MLLGGDVSRGRWQDTRAITREIYGDILTSYAILQFSILFRYIHLRFSLFFLYRIIRQYCV